MWNKEVERMRKRSIGNSSTKLVSFNHMQEEIQETTIQLNILNNADFILKMKAGSLFGKALKQETVF